MPQHGSSRKDVYDGEDGGQDDQNYRSSGNWDAIGTWEEAELGDLEVRLCTRVLQDLGGEEEEYPYACALYRRVVPEDELLQEEVEASWEGGEGCST